MKHEDSDDRFEPTPVPLGDGRHDIGDDVRAAIVRRLVSDWSRDPDLTPEKARQLAMWAGAAVRSLLHELGTLRDLSIDTATEDKRKLYVLLAEIRQCINDDHLMAAQRKVMAIETILKSKEDGSL